MEPQRDVARDLEASRSAASPEILALTSLRAPAAFAVVAFHFARDRVPETMWVLRQLVGSGFIAVSFFFVLSGFVLAYHDAWEPILSPRDRRRFWLRRLARIYPLYLLSLAIGAAAAWPKSLYELAAPRETARFALQLTLLNAWHHVAMFKWNWAAWSLSVEAAFYFAFPWIVGALRKLPTRRLVQLLAACWTATLIAPSLYTAFDPDGLGRPFEASDDALFAWYLKFFPIHRFPEFIAGVAAGVLFVRRRDLRERYGIAMTLGAASVVAALLASRWIPQAFLHSGVLLPLFVVLITGLAVPSAISRAVAWKPLIALGSASFATYILHVPLFLLMARFERAMWTFSERHLIVYAVLLIFASLAGHRWIEQPCRRLLVRRFAGR